MLRTAIRQAFLVGALMLLTTSVALAAPGGNKTSSSSSISLMTSGSASATIAPTYGGTVAFVETTTATSQPFVHLVCSQNGTPVGEAWNAVTDPSGVPSTFQLGPTSAWQSGAADCTAYLENWDAYGTKGKVTVLASTTFHVNG